MGQGTAQAVAVREKSPPPSRGRQEPSRWHEVACNFGAVRRAASHRKRWRGSYEKASRLRLAMPKNSPVGAESVARGVLVQYGRRRQVKRMRLIESARSAQEKARRAKSCAGETTDEKTRGKVADE